VIATDFDRNTTITADRVTFFAEKELVERMERVRGGEHVWRRWDWVRG
jgi:hypothetical protein